MAWCGNIVPGLIAMIAVRHCLMLGKWMAALLSSWNWMRLELYNKKRPPLSPWKQKGKKQRGGYQENINGNEN